MGSTVLGFEIQQRNGKYVSCALAEELSLSCNNTSQNISQIQFLLFDPIKRQLSLENNTITM
jgi:hypothetical protein